MMQSAGISITTLLFAITVALFGNGMLVIHDANAMDHETTTDSSSNAMCNASDCMREHTTCETHCVSTPTEPKQTNATTVDQKVKVFATSEVSFSVPIFSPPKTKNLIPQTSLGLYQIKSVIKRE